MGIQRGGTLLIAAALWCLCVASSRSAGSAPTAVKPGIGHALSILDTYVVDLQLGTPVYEKACHCQRVEKRDRRCVLYNATITAVRFMGDTTVYRTAQELQQVKLLVVPTHAVPKNGATTLTATVCNATDRKALIFRKQLAVPAAQQRFYYEYAHAIGPPRCLKRTNGFFHQPPGRSTSTSEKQAQ